MPSGMIHAAVSPEAMRASASVVSDCASPHAITVSEHNAQAIATITNLPNLSPIGPMMSCTVPCVNAYAVTMIEAAPTVTPISVAICGSSESAARTIAWLEKPASASNAMARVGVGEEEGTESRFVDGSGSGGSCSAPKHVRVRLNRTTGRHEPLWRPWRQTVAACMCRGRFAVPDATMPALRIVKPANAAAALGLAVSHLMVKPAFANLKFGDWSRILVGQINRGHYRFAIDAENRVQGFMGWALASHEHAEAWADGRRGLSFEDSQQGDCIVFN